MEKVSLSNLQSGNSVTISLEAEKNFISFRISCEEAFNLYAVKEDDEILVSSYPAGAYHRGILFEDVDAVIVKAAGKKKVYVNATVRQLPKAEAQDFNPPPPPAEANNLLAQIREKVRREMGVTRESFLLQNDTGRPGYEIDDEEPDIFEEELATLAQQEQENVSEANSENSVAEGDGENFETGTEPEQK